MGDVPSTELLRVWRGGDERAADELFSRYTSQLVTMAHIGSRTARPADRSGGCRPVGLWLLLAIARDGEVVLQRSGDLWRLLARITLYKLHHQVERTRPGGERSAESKRSLPRATSSLAVSPWPVHRTPRRPSQ